MVRHNPVKPAELAAFAVGLEVVKEFLHGQRVIVETFEFSQRNFTHIFRKGLLGLSPLHRLGGFAVYLPFVPTLSTPTREKFDKADRPLPQTSEGF